MRSWQSKQIGTCHMSRAGSILYKAASVSFSFSENTKILAPKKPPPRNPALCAVNERGHNGQRVDFQKSSGGWEDTDGY